MPGERNDPYRNFRFRVEIEGLEQAGFSEVAGFDASFDVVQYREGNEVITPRKLPGLARYGNITLRWGATESMELYEWVQECINGTVERKTVTIIAIDEEGGDVATWQVIEACRFATRLRPLTDRARKWRSSCSSLHMRA